MNVSEASDQPLYPTNNCSSTFSTPEFTNVAIVKEVFSILSVLACSIILIFIVILKRWKFFSQRLVLYLVISSLLLSIASLINKIDFHNEMSSFYTGFCIFGGFLLQLTSWMFINAIFGITMYLFFLIVFEKSTEKYEWMYIFYILVLPFLVNWIPFIKMGYQKAGLWCWIRSNDAMTCEAFYFGIYLQFFLLYIPLYITLTIECIIYVVILIKIRKKLRPLMSVRDYETKKKLKKLKNELLSLVAYPVIFFVFNIPLLANRIYSSINPTQPSLFLWYLSGLSLPLQGLFTAVAFTVGTRTWNDLSCARLKASVRRNEKIREYPLKTHAASDSVIVIQNNSHQTDYTTYS